MLTRLKELSDGTKFAWWELGKVDWIKLRNEGDDVTVRNVKSGESDIVYCETLCWVEDK